MERFPYNLIVAGLGACYKEQLAVPLSSWGDPDRHILVDIDEGRFSTLAYGKRLVADITHPPFTSRLSSFERQIIAVISTPEHLTPILALTELGVQNFIVEKPLVNNSEEAEIIRKITSANPKLKIYAIDAYITQVLPLYLLTGKITPDDPRWNWVEDEHKQPPAKDLYNSFVDQIGELEGMEVTILEGGQLGVPDLDKRPWLEKDLVRGGMLLDLGTHALAPLVTAGLIDSADSIRIDIAKRYVLGQDRKSFIDAEPHQPEIYVDTLLGVQCQGRNTPLSIRLAKTFHDGGVWKLIIRGSKGDISVGLRSGQKFTIEPNNGNNIQLRVRRESSDYSLSLAEADLYFKGLPNFDGNQKAALIAIAIIDKIKQKSL